MSIKLMTRVWECSKTKGASLLVLLALADSANDKGYCWPSMQTIAKKARIDRRQVIRIVKQLEELEEIKVQRRAKNGVKTSNMYWITLQGGSDKMSPPMGGSDMDTTTGGGVVSPPSDMDTTRVVVQESLKPPINHQLTVSRTTIKEGEWIDISSQVLSMICRVSGMASIPPKEIARSEQVISMVQAYGMETTEPVLKRCCDRWRKTPRKNGTGYYSVTNMGWVDWAQDELVGKVPVAREDLANLRGEELKAALLEISEQ